MKNLQIKLVRTAFISAALVLSTISIIFYSTLSFFYIAQADGVTNLIAENDGTFPIFKNYENDTTRTYSPYSMHLNEESTYRTRYFTVVLNEDLALAENPNLTHIASVDADDAYEMAKSVIKKKNTVGYWHSYRYRILQNAETDETTIIFLDCRENLFFLHGTMISLLLITLIFTLLITLIFALFSKKVLRPFAENNKRQKQFITDASHELKTPLSIISSNAQVLEYKSGKSPWTENIVTQCTRMGELINQLLALSKLEEMDQQLLYETVDLTQIATTTLTALSGVIEQKSASVTTDFLETCPIYTSKEHVTQLFSVLLENASKYVTEQGEISSSLIVTRKNVIFKIHNTADLPEPFDCERLFDRFYRPDHSRTSQTGGHGIGLSIAKKITTQLGGILEAKQENNGITFTATIPKNK